MSASVGSLVVSLGLDAAEFTSGMTRAEYQARKFGEALGTGIRTAATAAISSLASLGAAGVAFDSLIKKVGDFQDLAEKTGASAEALASFGVAAGTAGTDVAAVAAASIKLTKNLTGVDDESKAAGAAIKALGLDLGSFKQLAPEAQMESIAKALGGFADGAGKTAVATALLGKSGAEMLPFLKALEEQGGRQVILTAEQIRQADDYADKQAKAKAELQQYAQAMATQALPALTVLTTTMTDVVKEMLGLSGSTKDLASNNGVQVFAENAVRYLGGVLDAGQLVARVFGIIGTGLGATAATAGALAAGEFKNALRIQVEGAKDVFKGITTIGDNLISDRLKKNLDAQRQAQADAAKFGFGNRPGAPQPKLKFDGAAGSKGSGKNTAAQEAKAQLAADLENIKIAQEALTSGFANQERVLSALRSAGLRDESQYYAEKRDLLAQSTAAQEDGLQKQIARLEQEKLAGKDAIDNARKIADAQAKLAKVREDSATQAKIFGIEEEAAFKRIESAILSARQAAQDYLDTTDRAAQRQLAGIGKGDRARDFAAGLSQIEDKYQQQRQRLQDQRAQAELMGSFGPDASRQFDQQLALIEEFQGKAIESYKRTFTAIDEAQKSWLVGASEALRNYADEAANVAKHTEETVSNAIKGVEDQLVNLLTGKKFDVKALLEDIGGDLARNFVKENITGPVSSLLGNALGLNISDPTAKLGTLGNPMYVRIDPTTSLLGGLGKDFDFSKLVSGFLGIFGFGGGRAIGGPVSAGTMYRVNERGPEVLDINGKQFLMMGSKGGRVLSAGQSTAGPTVVINNTVGDVPTLSVVRQAQANTERRIAGLIARSQRYGGVMA